MRLGRGETGDRPPCPACGASLEIAETISPDAAIRLWRDLLGVEPTGIGNETIQIRECAGCGLRDFGAPVARSDGFWRSVQALDLWRLEAFAAQRTGDPAAESILDMDWRSPIRQETPPPTGRHDLVRAFGALERVESPEAFLRQANRALCPGGAFACTFADPAGYAARLPEMPFWSPPNIRRLWTDRALERALARAGFEAVRFHATPVGPLERRMAGTYRLLDILWLRGAAPRPRMTASLTRRAAIVACWWIAGFGLVEPKGNGAIRIATARKPERSENTLADCRVWHPENGQFIDFIER